MSDFMEQEQSYFLAWTIIAILIGFVISDILYAVFYKLTEDFKPQPDVSQIACDLYGSAAK